MVYYGVGSVITSAMGTINPQTYTTKTGATVQIRSAQPEDSEAIVALKRAIAAEGAYTLAESGEVRATPEREAATIEVYGHGEGSLYLVAVVDDLVVGFCDFANGHLRRTAHSGMLALFVAQDWRNAGIGRLLLQVLLDWATANPLIEKVTLAVFSTNERAIALYRKLGFQQEGYCPRDMKLGPGEYIDSVLMYRFM
jgi:RimJ/RimL family protein N-acetyltransferase